MKNLKDTQLEEQLYYLEEKTQERRQRLVWLVLAAVMGIMGVFLFLLTQDMSKTMVFMDFWTVVHGLLIIAEAISIRLALKRDNEEATIRSFDMEYEAVLEK
jgi:hypothetical protein